MKQCPHCKESIKNEAKKCKYCGEWIEEIDMNSNNGGFFNAIIRFLKYVGFSILSAIAIVLFHLAIGLLLAMFASLSGRQLGFLFIVLGGLVYTIRSFLAIGILYVTARLFNLVPSKKIGRFVFTIILILMTIDKLFGIWGYSPDLPNIIKVIYTILVIILCVWLCTLSKDIVEEEIF